MPKIESAEELWVIAQLFHTASLQMTKCYPRVNPPVHWSTILYLPCPPNPIICLKPSPLNSWKWGDIQCHRNLTPTLGLLPHLCFTPLPSKRIAFPADLVTDLCLYSRDMIQNGGCSKWPEQWLQKVQSHCGAAKTHMAQSLLQQQQLINYSTLSLHQPVPSPSTVCQCHLNFCSNQLCVFTQDSFQAQEKECFISQETFIAKKPQLLSNSKTQTQPSKLHLLSFSFPILCRQVVLCLLLVCLFCLFSFRPLLPLGWSFLLLRFILQWNAVPISQLLWPSTQTLKIIKSTENQGGFAKLPTTLDQPLTKYFRIT